VHLIFVSAPQSTNHTPCAQWRNWCHVSAWLSQDQSTSLKSKWSINWMCSHGRQLLEVGMTLHWLRGSISLSIPSFYCLALELYSVRSKCQTVPVAAMITKIRHIAGLEVL